MASHHPSRVIAGVAMALLASCGGSSPPPPAEATLAAPAQSLEIVDIAMGAGAPIAAGQKALVQYTGWLYESAAPDKKGKEFDSSRNTGQPFAFTLGAGEVIKGWDQGVEGMRAGGRRRLTIPANLGYGDVGANGVIPPGATLIFEVELVAIE